MNKVLVIYQSFGGSTQKMAEAVAAGAREVRGVEVVLKRVSEAGSEDTGLCLCGRLWSPKHVRRHVGCASRLLRSCLERARSRGRETRGCVQLGECRCYLGSAGNREVLHVLQAEKAVRRRDGR